MIFLSFVPWIVFGALVHQAPLWVAALAGLGLSLLAALPEVLARRPKLLGVGAVGFFLALSAAVLVWPGLEQEKAWAPALGNAGLAALILISVLAGAPFALQYARDKAPREVWDTPAFRATCLAISWVWFAAVSVMMAGSLLGRFWGAMPVWLHWAIPITACAAAVHFTHWYPDHVRRTEKSKHKAT
jgi:hypothetical protein